MIQQSISGPVEYKKGIYTTIKNRSINVHYFGDDHIRRTKCADPHALSLLSLLISSFNQPHPEVDVFVEVGLGTNYLNELIKKFQEKYNCLLKGLGNREICSHFFPDVRFHNVDFRTTLYFEYNEVINFIIKNNEKTYNSKNTDLLLNTIEGYAKDLKNGSFPYPTTFSADRELLRLTWIYDMVRARKDLYGLHRLTSFSENIEQFIIDLYYLTGISPSIDKVVSLLPSPILDLYPSYLVKKPYYFYRLAHEYRTIPEIQNDATIQQRFDKVLREELEKIRISYKNIRGQFIRETNLYGSKLIDFCVTQTSNFMDLYVCFRSLKPYVKHVIVICGVNHISNINQSFSNLGLESKASSSFKTIDTQYDKGVQCISVPIIQDTSQLTFNDDLFNDIEYIKPSYHFNQKRFLSRESKKNKRNKKNKKNK